VRCKSGAHFDECVVGRDQVGDEVRRIAEEKGWKVCYNCNGLVELSGDCNHVTYVSPFLTPSIRPLKFPSFLLSISQIL